MNRNATLSLLAMLFLTACSGEDKSAEQSTSTSTASKDAVAEVAIGALPDFTKYTDVKAKKRDFFNFLLPRIRKANDAELERRDFLLGLNYSDLSKKDKERLNMMAERYREKDYDSYTQLINNLLVKVDAVPASLVLAQGANESAWGTSRFARQGLNFFGIWCFTKGCGMTPKARNDGASHEVQKFESAQAAVNKYVITLNSHPAYEKLRVVRAQQRAADEALLGAELAVGLEKYSERGDEYIEEIQSMISFNKLEAFNRKAADSEPAK